MTDFSVTFQDRLSTALLADAAFRAGVPLGVAPPGLLPLDPAMKVAGPIITVQANNDLVSILAGIHQAYAGEVVVITNHTQEVALMGDLVAAEARRKDLAGLIVHGLVRDTRELIALGVPIFCRGRFPIGPLKLSQAQKGIGEIGNDITIGDTLVKPGDWSFGDADGVIFLSKVDLPAVFEWAESSLLGEAALTA